MQNFGTQFRALHAMAQTDWPMKLPSPCQRKSRKHSGRLSVYQVCGDESNITPQAIRSGNAANAPGLHLTRQSLRRSRNSNGLC